MNLNQFTLKAQEVIQGAQELAKQHTQQTVEPGHLLLSMLELEDSIVPYLLKKIEVRTEIISTEKITD
ncbi:MAG: hypothetical protein EBS07_12115, partial [Sphingobacteriia bacterium]|nr:hypothetical protein [Sphingobacteriia bacterium]